MSWPLALLLAVVQGLTEFLPVSSSGHLTLLQNAVQRLRGAPLLQPVALDVLLHLGTLAAVLVYFRRDLRLLMTSLLHGRQPATPAAASFLTAPTGPIDNGRSYLGVMVVALVPTALIGLALRNVVDALQQRPVIVSCLIGVTGLVLLATRGIGAAATGALAPTWTQALAIGTAQGLAVLPGLSRSGLTIAAGLALGLTPLAAFRWSFLLSIPVIAGAAAFELARPGTDLAGLLGGPTLVAAGLAGLVALGALKIVAWTLVRVRFDRFSWYCFAVGGGGALLFAVWNR